jgi:hypothetical protein
MLTPLPIIDVDRSTRYPPHRLKTRRWIKLRLSSHSRTQKQSVERYGFDIDGAKVGEAGYRLEW